MAKNRSFQAQVVTSAEEVARFDAKLKQEHYLKQAPPVGDFLRQVVVRRGQWVGLGAGTQSGFASAGLCRTGFARAMARAVRLSQTARGAQLQGLL